VDPYQLKPGAQEPTFDPAPERIIGRYGAFFFLAVAIVGIGCGWLEYKKFTA
jgi:hypothetical protein